MGKDLIKLLYERASKSKDPKAYIKKVEELYKLMDLTDDEFIKEMGW